MRREYIAVVLVLAVMSLLVFPAFAEKDSSLVSENQITDEKQVTKKVVNNYAQSKIKTLVMIGKGLATSPEDPKDFMIVKAGVAVIRVNNATGTAVTKGLGVMFLDEEKFRIRDVAKEEGKISGYLYKNKTKKGEFSVFSVIKGRTEVWVGTLTLDSKTYHLYILEAPRKIKPVELKEKISDYCRANKNDLNCNERMPEYCKNNPDDARCKEIFREYCVNNLDDTRCREYIKGYCEEHPEMENCRMFVVKRTASYCKEHPDAKVCVTIGKELVEYCMKNPNTQRCRDFCAKNPNKCLKVVKNLADFCINNSDNAKCVDYCKKHPKACVKLVKNVADLCIKEPTHEKCIDYCKAHPVACKKVTVELANFCI
ncbi:MAG: hypothetical protein KAU95_00575, partial [Candidatus Aenigmarchaeota archaeon]|nr:hypothetical protein [Candidatus Aenigmarchaeota archaeon]